MMTDQSVTDVEALIAEAADEIPSLSLPLGELVSSPTDAVPVPTPQLRIALEIVQAFAERIARDSRLEEWPRSATFGQTLANLVAIVPAALAEGQLAEESVADWRSLTALIGEWIELVDSLRAAQVSGLGNGQRARLDQLLELRADWMPPHDRRLPELADLAVPVVRSRLELALALVGAWPPSPNGPTCLYARILLGLWRDLTDERWPKRCAEAGCGELLAAHRKNMLCEVHAAERQRKRVARRRSGRTVSARR